MQLFKLKSMAEEKKEGGKSVIYPCFGGSSSAGIITALAAIEAVKEVGLDKAIIGCLAILPTYGERMQSQIDKATKVITVDGCPMGCAKKTLGDAGLKSTRNILLTRDTDLNNKPLEVTTENQKELMHHISEEDIKKAKDVIIKAVLEQ